MIQLALDENASRNWFYLTGTKKLTILQSPIRRTLYILLALATHWFKCNENDEPWQLIKMFSHTSIYGSSGMVIEALY